MKKILLIGKLNNVVNETNQFLSKYFHVQICSENAGVLEGMLKIVNPDLVPAIRPSAHLRGQCPFPAYSAV